jgi:NAD(P)-dependent dehydrogenase (short-subunit alcohol dehydrogenase family)
VAGLVTRCVISRETDLWEMPVFEVANQHVLVTAGTSGFGRHFARLLASNGARISIRTSAPGTARLISAAR